MEQRKRDLTKRVQTLRNAFRYFFRALRLKCPVCGLSPMFIPALKTRTFYDWFTPLDGCHRCGYPYVREPGYWLVPVWIIGFGNSTACGAVAALIAHYCFNLDLIWVTIVGSATTGIVAFLFARHAKALFLALDLYFDPED